MSENVSPDDGSLSADNDLAEAVAEYLAPGQSRERLEAVVDSDSKFASTPEFLDNMDDRMLWTCAIENAAGSYGTGVLVGKDLVLTNYHVIERLLQSPAKAVDASCRFDFWKASKRRPASLGRAVEFASNWMVKYNGVSQADIDGADSGFGDALDYALLRLAEPVGDQPLGLPPWPDPGAMTRGWLSLPIAPSMPKRGAHLFVVQYPCRRRTNGPLERQRSTISQGRVCDIIDGGRRIRHNASTFHGSSGSACFDSDLNIVALHHAGDPDYDNFAKGNQAIPINRIVSEIKTIAGEAIVGVVPKRPEPQHYSAAVGTAQLQRTKAELQSSYTRAAKILLDRQKPEESVLESNAMVHVLVARTDDQHLRFLQRLEQLTLPCRSLPDCTDARITYLREARSRNGWIKESIDWPDPQEPLESAIESLRKALSKIRKPANFLIETVAELDDLDTDRERRLVAAFAKLCAELRSPDQLQAFVVYLYSPGFLGLSAFKARRFAQMWTPETRPDHCGASLLLTDVSASELGTWRNYLNRAWGIDDVEINNDLKSVFQGGRKLSIAAIEAAIEPKIMGYFEKTHFSLISGGGNVV